MGAHVGDHFAGLRATWAHVIGDIPDIRHMPMSRINGRIFKIVGICRCRITDL
jgi:hypothetical protein